MSKRPDLIPIYHAADWRMSDSRILARLGRMRDIDLQCYPGADQENFDILKKRFPDHTLVLVAAPHMQSGSPEWEAVLTTAEAAQADLTLLCISFPKQEFFARDLKVRDRMRGVAVCAGVSIDFLSGRQSRAPEIFRRIGAVWFYRLISWPKRLWKRYLVDGPRIFLLSLREER